MEPDKSIKIEIIVKYSGATVGTGQNEFTTLQQLKIWLDLHPQLAKELGYTKAKK